MSTHTFCRVFDLQSQELFARISCDRNPVHMDEVAARRTHAGTRIVHGIHPLIWAMDCIAQRVTLPRASRSLKVRFLQPIYVGDNVTLKIEPASNVIRASLQVHGEEVSAIVLTDQYAIVPSLSLEGVQASLQIVPPAQPQEYDLSELTELGGALNFGPHLNEVESAFPHAIAAFGLRQIATLVSTSCLVGMIVPGLHSIFSGLDITFDPKGLSDPGCVQFRVQAVNSRFRSVVIAIQNHGTSGILEAISRSPPVHQLSVETARSFVSEGEFSGAVALVIGGSRGLGEVTAKLISSGGGKVIITYASGERDAQKVAGEIVAQGYLCQILHYDVRHNAVQQLASLHPTPTHIYYFATPPISKRKVGVFDATRLSEFETFYLRGLFEIARAFDRPQKTRARVFYPSTSFIDARPTAMTEYAMAKAAGEILCADLSRFLGNVEILTRRLPRLSTDQTSGAGRGATADPVGTLLPIIREMHG